jgi:hypothetical protein
MSENVKEREMKKATIERASILGRLLGVEGFLRNGTEGVDWEKFGEDPERQRKALEIIFKDPDGIIEDMTHADWQWLIVNFWKETNKIGISLGRELDSLRDTMMARANLPLPDSNSTSQSIPVAGEIRS